MLTKKVLNTIQLVKENCTPSEAIDMIETLINDRIRLHNIQMLRNWERNHRFDSTPFDQKIGEIKTQRKNTREFLNEAREQGLHVEVSASIEVKLVNKPFTHDVKLELTHN